MDTMFFLFLLLVFGIMTVQGNAVNNKEIESQIVGGVSVPITSYPFMVAVLYKNQLICGGSIIGPLWVLTSGYCAMNTVMYNDSESKIRVGSATYDTGGMLYSIESSIWHEQAWKQEYLIGLIKLKTAMAFSASIKAIKLANSTQSAPKVGTLCQIAGWGNKNATDNVYSKTLQMASVPITSTQECSTNCKRQFSKKLLCTWNKMKPIYPSYVDDGGPLIEMISGVQTQIGIFNEIVIFCNFDRGLPAIYNFIPAIRDWIKNKTGI